jgi:MFS family permease
MSRTILPVAALLLSVAFLVTGHGLLQTLLPLRGDLEGFAPFSIAMLGSSYFLGYVAGCLAAPRLIIRAGHIRTFAALVSLASSAALAHAMVVDPALWIAARAVTGFCLAGLYLVIESWLNERATNQTRGTIMAAYTTVSLTVITAGQMMVPLFDTVSFVQLSIASILMSVSAIPIAMTRAQQPAPVTIVRFRPITLYRLSPAGVVAIFLIGVANGAFWSLAPVYGQQMGLSVTMIAAFMSLAVIGGAVAQYPLGHVSDRVDRRYVMIGVSAAIVVFGLLLSGFFAVSDLYRSVLVFLFGGPVLAAYTIATAHVFDHAKSEGFVEISAGLLLLFGLGSALGPVPASAVMQWIGPGGLFVFMTAAHVCLIAFVALRMRVRAAPPTEQKESYTLANTAPVVVIGDAVAVEESQLVVDPTEGMPTLDHESLAVEDVGETDDGGDDRP